MKNTLFVALFVLVHLLMANRATADDDSAVFPGIPTPTYENPVQRAEGPFDRLVIRNVRVIGGSGAPARGPCDIVVEYCESPGGHDFVNGQHSVMRGLCHLLQTK